MVTRPCPAMGYCYARHTDHYHKSAIIVSLQGHHMTPCHLESKFLFFQIGGTGHGDDVPPTFGHPFVNEAVSLMPHFGAAPANRRPDQ